MFEPFLELCPRNICESLTSSTIGRVPSYLISIEGKWVWAREALESFENNSYLGLDFVEIGGINVDGR